MTDMAIPFRGGTNEMTSADSNSTQVWQLGTWSDGDHKNVIRWRDGLHVPDRARPIKIMVKIGYPSNRADGQPSPDELDQLEVIENTLIRELADRDAAIVLIMTGYWAREFIAYGSSYEFLQEWGPTVLQRWSGDHPACGVDAENDPRWKTFKQYTK
jgi:hypothetical protein